MVNTHKKGQRKELLCSKELELEGFKTVFRSYTIRMGPIFRGIDFADSFDVIGINEKTRTWKFVSVKHYGSAKTNYPDEQEKIKLFAIKSGLPGSFFELWIWHKPAWRGRGKNKKWVEAHFDRRVIAEVTATGLVEHNYQVRD